MVNLYPLVGNYNTSKANSQVDNILSDTDMFKKHVFCVPLWAPFSWLFRQWHLRLSKFTCTLYISSPISPPSKPAASELVNLNGHGNKGYYSEHSHTTRVMNVQLMNGMTNSKKVEAPQKPKQEWKLKECH